ncbi:ankyrin repeat-containing domain protein [Pelagophyceae sp. CCMP2097]|nr:ankyrin repeat-containing domain protein [Pelagophyceae sp. CCMP2097]
MWQPREELWGHFLAGVLVAFFAKPQSELAALVAVESGVRFAPVEDVLHDGAVAAPPGERAHERITAEYAAVVKTGGAAAAARAAARAAPRAGETALTAACRRGATEAVRALLAAGAAVDARDPRGTALDAATEARQLAAATALLRSGAQVSKTDDALLRAATHEGDDVLIALLLERGAPPLLSRADDESGQLGADEEDVGETSCVLIAARHQVPAVLEAYAKWAAGEASLPLDAPHGPRRVTALMVAAARAGADAARGVRCLLRAGCAAAAADAGGRTALHRAAAADSALAVDALAAAALSSLAGDAYLGFIDAAQSKDKRTALHCAAAADAAAAVAALLRAGANAMLFDGQRTTALGIAQTINVDGESAVRYELEAMRRAVLDGDFAGCLELAARRNWALDGVVEGLEDTPLVAAARCGDADAVRTLVAGGARLTAASAKGEAPLRAAAEAGRLGACAALLAAGAKPGAALDDGGAQLLLAACFARDAGLVDQLLRAAGGDATGRPLERTSLRRALHAAASNADDDSVEALLRHCPQMLYADVPPPAAKRPSQAGGDSPYAAALSLFAAPPPGADDEDDEDGECYLTRFPADGDAREPALLAACRAGAAGCVAALTREVGALRSALDDDRRCALHHAAAADRASVVETLCGDDASLVTCRDARGAASLHAAAAAGAGAAIGALLRHGADATLADALQRTPHDVALQRGHDRAALQLDAMAAAVDDGDFDECARLAAAGNWPIDWRARGSGDTALVAAARRGAPDGVAKLLACGAAVDATALVAAEGEGPSTMLTPLGAAARAGHLDVCAALLAAGAKPEALADRAAALLEAAVVADEPELVDALLAKGADATGDRAAGEQGAFVVAVELGSPEIVASFIARAVQPKLLDVDAPYGEFRTVALHAAASRGRAAVVESLLDAGAAVDAVDARGRSALHHAAQGDHDGVLRVLVSRGADVRRLDALGRTPLAVAVAASAKSAESALKMAESMKTRST